MGNKNGKDYHKELLHALGLLKEAEIKNSLNSRYGDFIVYGAGGESFDNNFKDLHNEKKHKKRKLKFMK